MWAKLLKENRSLAIKIRDLEELIKRNETEMSDIDLDIYEEVNKELNIYVRRLYNKRFKLKYFTDINNSFDIINSESQKLYRIMKSWGESGYLIHEKEENGNFKIVNNCSDITINNFVSGNNIHSILHFIKERTNIHRNYDVISTKKSVCFILKHYKSSCSILNKFPKDIVNLICKKALSF